MSKLITVSENLLEDILPHLKGTPLEKKIKDLINNTSKIPDTKYFLRFSEGKRQDSERSEWFLFSLKR